MSIYGGGLLNISYVICSLVSTPVKSYFGRFFVYNFFRRPTASKRLVSKDMEFSCASFGKLKIGFLMFSSAEIGLVLASF